jgi:hypothetical protein
LPYMQAEIGRYLQAHPSRHALDPVAYAQRSEMLGAWELVPGPYEPLQPDNSISVHSYGQRAEVVSSEQALHLMESFWKDVIDIILDVMEATRGDVPARQLYSIRMMATIAELYPKYGIVRGHMSYLSHYEGYRNSFDKDGSLAAEFQTLDESAAPWVDETMRAVLDGTDDQGRYRGDDPILRKWSDRLAQLYDECFELATQGLLHSNTDHYAELVNEIGNEHAEERWNRKEDRQLSDFHTKLLSMKTSDAFFNSPEFASYRMLVNCFYSYLPLLGFSPNMKHLFCYLVTKSVERVLNIEWQNLFAVGRKGVRLS